MHSVFDGSVGNERAVLRNSFSLDLKSLFDMVMVFNSTHKES